MQKKISRIIVVILLLFIVIPKKTYANVSIASPAGIRKYNFIVVITISIIVWGIIIIKNIISLLALKIVHKNNLNDEDKSKMKKYKERITIFTVLILFFGYLDYILIYKYISGPVLITFGIFLISILYWIAGLKKARNIVWIINSIAIIIIMLGTIIPEVRIEKYNTQFSQYYSDYKGENEKKLYNAEELIKAIIKNNKTNKRKITVDYKGQKYKTVGELDKLLNIIDLNKIYLAQIRYNNLPEKLIFFNEELYCMKEIEIKNYIPREIELNLCRVNYCDDETHSKLCQKIRNGENLSTEELDKILSIIENKPITYNGKKIEKIEELYKKISRKNSQKQYLVEFEYKKYDSSENDYSVNIIEKNN